MRVVFPLAFVIVSIALILAVLQAVGMISLWENDQKADELISKQPLPTTETSPTPEKQGKAQQPDSPAPPTPATQPRDTPGSPTPPATKPIHVDGEFPDLQLPTTSSATPGDSSSTATAGIDSPPPPVSPSAAGGIAATDPSPSASPPKAGFLANQNLNTFLHAKTLDERLALMSKSRYTREQLESSCLAGPLKEVKSVNMVETVSSVKDNTTQYLYFVSFEDPESDRQRQRIVMQVVERPGVHPPRVHGDAFIEHYDKKFTEFAKHPNKEVTTFHCIAEARTADLAKDIPKELKPNLIRLVIKTHPYGAPAFNAYLNKNSPLMEHIGSRKELPYTEPRFCILSFRWNTTDPNYPYIELNDIVCQGWER